jgi:hypothetical protein
MLFAGEAIDPPDQATSNFRKRLKLMRPPQARKRLSLDRSTTTLQILPCFGCPGQRGCYLPDLGFELAVLRHFLSSNSLPFLRLRKCSLVHAGQMITSYFALEATFGSSLSSWRRTLRPVAGHLKAELAISLTASNGTPLWPHG